MRRKVGQGAIAVLAILLAVALRWAILPLIGPVGPYITDVPVICVLALLLGRWAAIVASVVGIVATELTIVLPTVGPLTLSMLVGRIAFVLLGAVAVAELGQRARDGEAMARARARRAMRAEHEARMLRERESARAKELAAVLDFVPAAVFVTRRPDAQNIEGNRFCADMLRMPRGVNVSMSVPAEARSREFRFMRRGQEVPTEELPIQIATRGREVRDSELDIVYRDGAVRHLIGNATPLRDRQGNVRGAVAAFTDVTALKDVERQLREAHQRKDEFISMLSHELRNPLAPIGNAIHILRRAAPGSPQAVQALEVLARQTDHLRRIVDELLEASRIARGRVEIRRERLDLASQIRSALQDYAEAFQRAGVELRQQDELRPTWIDADPVRVTQILGNLLSNALKFTSAGGHVEVGLACDEGWASLTVRDDGDGMAPETLRHLFEPFVQEAPGLARSRGGLGLGLALVKVIVELHGGRVRASSDGVGRGSLFEIRLPMRPGAEREESEPAWRPGSTEVPGQHVE